MRLLLLPISTRRTLLYCQKLNVATTTEASYLDKATVKAAQLWAGWEKKESGWQKQVVVYGNKALKRIPFEEWGLKSVPPLSSRKQEEELTKGPKSVEVEFPKDIIPEGKVLELLGKLGTERQAYHKRTMMYCFVGMPISAPFALIPIIPNIPFFYLCYRAWSHWRALSGSKHIMFLLDKKLLFPKPSSLLESLYGSGASGLALNSKSLAKENDPTRDTTEEQEEAMILTAESAKTVAQSLEIPELEVELDRAIWQVEESMKKNEEIKEQKHNLEQAEAKSKAEAEAGKSKKEE